MRELTPVLALLLAGCATGVPVERQVVVSGGQFIAVQGEASLIVRTFVEDPGGQRREVTGASCDVESSLYTARLTTPSRLVLPNFGPQSPELAVNCNAGKLLGSGRVAIVTRWQQTPGFWGPPGFPYWRSDPLGWRWDGPSFPVSDYPNLSVVLE